MQPTIQTIPARLLSTLAIALALAACGGGGGGGGGATPAPTPTPTPPVTPPDPLPPPVAASPGITVLAGLPGGHGNVDGSGRTARFMAPTGVAIDGAGNAYMLDATGIRKITPAGAVTTLAGYTDAGGAAAAPFVALNGIAIDLAGNLYVSDQHAIRKITPARVVSTYTGAAGAAAGAWADGNLAGARFNAPGKLVFDGAGNLYVADRGNYAVRKITPTGVVTTPAGKIGGVCATVDTRTTCTSRDGTGQNAAFASLGGIAVDPAGTLYVGDNYTVRKISGAGVVSTLAGVFGQPGQADGGAAARFARLDALVADAGGNLYATDAFGVRRISAAGVVSTLAGGAEYGYADGAAKAARFRNPNGIAFDGAGNLLVADTDNFGLRKLSPTYAVSTVAGGAAVTGHIDASGAEARFHLNALGSASVVSGGNLYLVDQANHAIRKVSAAGVVTTVAGGTAGGIDGSGAAARFQSPAGVTADAAGNLYVTDAGRIRKVTPAGLVTTIVDTAAFYNGLDATGGYAGRSALRGIAIDAAGNLYAADGANAVVLKVSATGAIGVLAGTVGTLGGGIDGVGVAASFGGLSGMVIDAAGNLYLADSGNTIRKIGAGGVVTTVAGKAGQFGYADGAGAAARFGQPVGVALDAAGNLYVADFYNNAVRKITPAGVVSTIAGTPGVIGVVVGGLPGSLSQPGSVSVGEAGVLYVTSENAILKIQP